MSLPLASDYFAAIQSPATTFHDAELRAGDVATTPLGLPAMRTGSFSIVFQVASPATGTAWAVKCFTVSINLELRERYAAIAAHLASAPLPFISRFQWLEKGVLVGKQWHPVLKMPWVEGETLDQFIDKRADQPQAVRQLAALWVKVAERMQAAGVAHGDLSHENIVLVTDPQKGRISLRLIDYDGMYVPALAGRTATELGHAAFQHPGRAIDERFGPELDRFSHLVIYTSLRAVASGGRALWERFYNGEGLIFGPADFVHPDQSPALGQLWHDADPAVRELAGHLFLAAHGPLDEVPALDALIDGDRVVPLSEAQRRSVEEALSGDMSCGAYVAEISRNNPTAVLVIIDQSASMAEPLGGTAQTKAAFAAEFVNRLVIALAMKSAKADGIRDIFHVGVIVYGDQAQFGWSGALANRQLVSIGELANQPLRVETREQLVDDGAGGMITQKSKTPVWLEPAAKGGSAACAAFRLAHDVLARFVADHPDSFPPLVFVVADGTATDGDLAAQAGRLKRLATDDGGVLLFAAYLAADAVEPILCPATEAGISKEAWPFYRMSSGIPRSLASEYRGGLVFTDTTRGFAVNADLVELIKLLSIGTRIRPGASREMAARREPPRPAASPPPPPAAPSPDRPLVFISAKSEDYHRARVYFEFLSKRGVRAFLSCESLPEMGTSDYREAIDEALDQAKHMIVVTSSAEFVRSSWVKAEWGLFINEKRSDRKAGNLVTVIAGGMTIAQLPASLRYYEVIQDGPEALERVYTYVSR